MDHVAVENVLIAADQHVRHARHMAAASAFGTAACLATFVLSGSMVVAALIILNSWLLVREARSGAIIRNLRDDLSALLESEAA